MSDQTDPQQARDAFDREEIDAMRQLRRSGETARNIAQTFRTSASIVQRICALDAVPPAPAPAQQVSPNDAAVLRAAIRSLDCGVHHCRYCEAKSPAWEHVQGCAYVESQRHYREAYDIIQRLEAHPAAPAPPRHERQEHAHDFHEFMVCRVCGLTEAAALNECHHCGDDTSVKNNRCWWCLRPLAAASPSAPQGQIALIERWNAEAEAARANDDDPEAQERASVWQLCADELAASAPQADRLAFLEVETRELLQAQIDAQQTCLTQAARLQAQEWQPIETARKSRDVILVYGEENGHRIWGRACYFKGIPGDGEGWIASSFYTEPTDDMRGSFTPTHWQPMPLPAPPVDPETGAR